jgi:hypothetical protein
MKGGKKMRTKILAGLVASCVLMLASQRSEAAPCGKTAPSTQFDSFYAPLWGCQQARVDDMWSRFSFDAGDWDQGFGYEDPCNDTLPLKRTFNALQVLAYGVTSAPTCSTSNSNVGLWAYCYAGNSIDELDGVCGDSPRAYTQAAPVVDNYTNLYMAFFYGETVIQRAGTIFHEARHAQGWCQHDGSCLDGGDSCDPNWANGCVGIGSSSGVGANAYTVLYMSWFAATARSNWINSTIRADAVAEGNRYLARRFGQDPCFRLNSAGYSYSTC